MIYNWGLCLTVYKYCLLIQLTKRNARRQNNISLLEETLNCAKGLRRRSNLRYTSTVTPWSTSIPTTYLCDTADCTFQCCVNYLSIYISRNICFSKVQQPLVGQDFLVIEAWWWHWDTPHSIGLFWISDDPDAEISEWRHATFTRDRLPCPRRDSNSQSQHSNGSRSTP